MQEFIHLHVHTEYSMVDGIIRIKPMIDKAEAHGMAAIAITDQYNLFAMVKFYREAISRGIKPIIGADVIVQSEDDEQRSRVVFLCQNADGYKSLTQLISKAYREGQSQGVPIIQESWLKSLSNGLIAIIGMYDSVSSKALLAENQKQAHTFLNRYQTIFSDRLYLEVCRLEKPQDQILANKLLPLAESLGIAVVATNDARFLDLQDYDAHEARFCIHDGYLLNDEQRPKPYTNQQYLKSVEEMKILFSDMSVALENSVEIAKRCNVELTLGENYLPDFPIPEGNTLDEYFKQQSWDGLKNRLFVLFGDSLTEKQRAEYHHRLEIELDVIISMGFPGYFLIVADFIKWAKENDVPVGPGRGSGAGSLVAYALEITDIDPMEFDLLFERFLNPERVSMPDFDVDFCMEGRDRVIHYVEEKYGRDSVSQIITYGRMAAKAVVRDVGRVLGHPYGYVDKLAKLIPFELGITLDKALEDSEPLRLRYESEDDVKVLFDLAKKLEGITRNAGKHAGGVVIAPTVLTDFSPLFCEEGGDNLVTQFDKDDIEAVGLVKFDFLGLRTLTIIHWSLQQINRYCKQHQQPPIDIALLPKQDEKVFDLIKAGKTTAVFQLESRGMKELIIRLQPDCFEDIVALVALFRPGPLQSGMVDDFINRKHGRSKVEYPHPALESILQPTYGVILYQEQVMQIAQELAGYTLGGADLLRRAMGKKKPEEMAKQRLIFMEGATGNGVEEQVASHIFDLMEKFAGYGFNKSHSVAYAAISYQTAWLKAHYPAFFMAAVLSSDMDSTDKMVNFIAECKDQGIQVLQPNINSSDYHFMVDDSNNILYGLGAIKGVGRSVVESIVQERTDNGQFKTFNDFMLRVDSQKINRRCLESLVKAGAFDSLSKNRKHLLNNIENALQMANQNERRQAVGQQELFGGFSDISLAKTQEDDDEDWSNQEKFKAEKETLGLYITGHPIEDYEAELKTMDIKSIGSLEGKKKSIVKVGGLLHGIRVMKTKRGDRMAILTIEDRTGRLEVAVFSELFNQYCDILEKDELYIIEGEISLDDYSGGIKMSALSIKNIIEARTHYMGAIVCKMKASDLQESTWEELSKIIQSAKGGCSVIIHYFQDRAEASIELGEEWHVLPDDTLIQSLGELFGLENIYLKQKASAKIGTVADRYH